MLSYTFLVPQFFPSSISTKSRVVKILVLSILSIHSSMRGSGYVSGVVDALRRLKSTQNHIVPSFLELVRLGHTIMFALSQ